MSKYGLPYKGCKSKIAENIVAHFPKAEHFYDMFCGGGSITHCAMLSGKFQYYHMNDKRTGMAQLFKECVLGQHHDDITRWVTREEFMEKRSSDPFINIFWSFGNGGFTYMYSYELQEWKRAMHQAICHDDYEPISALGITPPQLKSVTLMTRRLELTRWIERNEDTIRKKLGVEGRLGELENMERLQHIERIECLREIERIGKADRLTTTCGDYRDVPIETNSVIYCDIPYRGTTGYEKKKGANSFDYEAFYEWAESFGDRDDIQIFISEYDMP